MPQSSQFIGVNSVTNIELDKGVMPAPIIRNADWLVSLAGPRLRLPASLADDVRRPHKLVSKRALIAPSIRE
jgi:hypothetical protein